jgi:hypothetical protein
MLSLKSRVTLAIAFGVFATLVDLSPANAERLDFTCNLTPSEQVAMRQLGLTSDTVMFIDIDTDGGTATDGATYPGDSAPRKVSYVAKFTATQVSWSTPPDPDDGTFATRIFDRGSKVLNTVDPDGHSTLWNCR